MTLSNFKRVIEDFNCFHCGLFVNGSGYTDHCPKCLWSRHVDDLVPGDRASACNGAMEPTSAVFQRDYYTINYTCQKCGVKRKFKAASADSLDELMGLVKRSK